MCQPTIDFLGHTSNKLSLDLKPIGRKPKTHLFKVSFSLLLAERLCQWIRYVLCGVNSLHLDELLLKIFTYNMETSFNMLGLLVRPGLLSKGYGTVVVVVQCNGIYDITPSSTMNFLNQNASLAASEVAM